MIHVTAMNPPGKIPVALETMRVGQAFRFNFDTLGTWTYFVAKKSDGKKFLVGIGKNGLASVEYFDAHADKLVYPVNMEITVSDAL